MDLETFYNLKIDDMFETVFLLKMKYAFSGLSKKDCMAIALKIKNGFKPNNLKAYITWCNKKGLERSEKESEWFYSHHNKPSIHSYVQNN